MNECIRTTILAFVAVFALMAAAIATIGFASAPASFASEIGDEIRATLQQDAFNIAYEVLNELLKSYFGSILVLQVAILIAAIASLFIPHKREKPAPDGPAFQKITD